MTLRALVFLLCLTPTAALAERPTLDDARVAYEELRYDEAAALLEAALGSAALDVEDRDEALLLAGIVEVIRGDDERARARFRELVERAPDATLPRGLSPKITRVFDEVRAEHVTPPAPEPGPPALAPQSTDVPAPAASPLAPLPEPAPPGAEAEGGVAGVSGVALGIAAGAALTAVIVVAGAGALVFFARGQPPASSLGTMQLP